MAKQNYSFVKRQKELDKKRKKEEKKLRKLTKDEDGADVETGLELAEGEVDAETLPGLVLDEEPVATSK